MSPIIPSQQWANIISEKLGLHVAEPKENYPMFLVDSEGMGIRGEAFDFITTSPPAVIAKVLMQCTSEAWVGIRGARSIRLYLSVLFSTSEDEFRWGGGC